MCSRVFENAQHFGRKLLEIRVSRAMFDRLGIEERAPGSLFKGTPIVIVDTAFQGTIEVILGPLQ
jgi:hypothetical protein